MERVTICASLKFKDQIRQAITRLGEVEVEAMFPNLDSGIRKEDVTLELMRSLETEHFLAINQSDGLYVICPEGYIGSLVSAEMGYARAQEKPIICSEMPEDLGMQALMTNQIALEDIQDLKNL